MLFQEECSLPHLPLSAMVQFHTKDHAERNGAVPAAATFRNWFGRGARYDKDILILNQNVAPPNAHAKSPPEAVENKMPADWRSASACSLRADGIGTAASCAEGPGAKNRPRRARRCAI